jgi:hypothetical protein
MSLTPQKRLVRRWGKLWRLMRRRGDRAGMTFAVERAKIWREYVNRMEKLKATVATFNSPPPI